MAMLGMDVDQVTATASHVTSLSSQLQTLITQLNTQVHNLSGIWTGTDSTQFVNTTWPANKTNLDKCKADLDTLVSQLKKEITQQQTASQS